MIKSPDSKYLLSMATAYTGLFLLVVAHGFVYQILENRHFPYAEIVGLATIVVLWYQWRGFRLYANR